jgi:uncharacterized protein
MSLKEQIQEDMKSAMRAKQAERLLAIRGLLAACKQKEVDERIDLDDAAVIAIIDKLVKQRKDSISQFAQAQRNDLVEKETAELQLLESYLPQRMSQQDIQEAIAAIVAQLQPQGPGDMGKVMAEAKSQLAGKADMGQVSQAVKQALSQSAG